MGRFLFSNIVLGIVFTGLLLAGCEQPASVKQPKKPFGPVYSVESADDPVVAKALESIEATGAPIAGAEIRGFLVDWIIRTGNSTMIREFAVMKNGDLYHVTVGMGRPFGAFGRQPSGRLKPEPNEEAKARKHALGKADKAVAKLNPEFASVEPTIFCYMLRVHREDGTYFDAWVSPSGEPYDRSVEFKMQKFPIKPPRASKKSNRS